MTQLIKYDAALKALTECHRVDEVKTIRDKAEAVRVYARQAKDLDMQNMAAEIRLRAERRAGELLAEMKANGQRERKGGDRKSKLPKGTLIPKLPDLGISKKQSHTWQKVAAIPEAKFEAALAKSKDKYEEITTANVMRSANNGTGPKAKEKSPFENFDEDTATALLYRGLAELVEKLWPPKHRLSPVVITLRNFLKQIEREDKTRSAK